MIPDSEDSMTVTFKFYFKLVWTPKKTKSEFWSETRMAVESLITLTFFFWRKAYHVVSDEILGRFSL